MSDIQQFEKVLNEYSQQIAAKKSEIASAERELIVAQTELNNYKKQAEEIEDQCLTLTGKPISELDNLITSSIQELEKVMGEITATSQNGLSDELRDSMQFQVEY